ncbi:MAG: fluoride efflux transporter CrcB [Bradymonadaceae bacterium]
MIDLLMLAIGGGIGAVCRYAMSRAVSRNVWAEGFPWATLMINVLGSLGLGILLALRFGEVPVDPYGDRLFLFLGVGFFAAFTTFSTFAVETLELCRQARRRAVVYLLSTIFVCLGAFSIAFVAAGGA